MRWISGSDIDAMEGLAEASEAGSAGCVGAVAGVEDGSVWEGGARVSERPLRWAFCLSDSVRSTRSGRPLRLVPLRLRRADIAVSLSSYSQKPKPFGRPVS